MSRVPHKGGLLKTFGSVYCELSGQEIRVFQPESRLRGIPAREWIVKDLDSRLTPIDFAYDHGTQLIVFVLYE